MLLKNKFTVPSSIRFPLRRLTDSQSALILTNHKKTCHRKPLYLRLKPYKLSLKQMSVCDCVTDESECLPWGELSLVNGDHSPLVFSRLQFSLSELFWQFLHRGPRLRTIICNVFVSYLKNWQRSQIAPIIHISGFWNSCILKAAAVIAYLSLPVGMVRSTRRFSRFHTPGVDLCSYLASPC